MDTSKIQKKNVTQSISSKEINSSGPDSYHELPRVDYFPIYESIFKTQSKHRIRIADLPDAIRTWKVKTDQGKVIDISRRYKYLKSKNPLSSEQEIKRQCPAITTNGVFIINKKGNPSKLTGYLFNDYDADDNDDLEDPVKQRTLAAEKIGKYCLSIHRSFRGNGLHVLIRVDLKNAAEIPLYQEAISKILGLTHDKACKNINRLMFIPYDPGAVKNLDPEVFKLPRQIKNRKVNGSDNPIVSQLEVPGIPLRVDAITKYIDDNDLWGKARMQHNIIYGIFSRLLGEFTYPELESFIKTDELRLKLFHPASDTGKDLKKVMDQLRRIYNSRKQPPPGFVFKDIFFSDSLTWKGSYVYAGLRMYANKQNECWVSQITLARKLSISRATVMRGINELIELKYVIRKKGKGRNNLYYLVCDFPFMDNYRPYGKVFHDILFADNLTWKGKAVYIGLMIYIGAKGEWRVSNSTLAKDIKVSIDTVERGIKEVITAGIFTREYKKGGNNLYRLYVAHSVRVPLTATLTQTHYY